jgi:hypothetical protein
VGISPSRRSRTRSSRLDQGAVDSCNCCTRRSTDRHLWAWFPAWRNRSAGRSAQTQEQWYACDITSVRWRGSLRSLSPW